MARPRRSNNEPFGVLSPEAKRQLISIGFAAEFNEAPADWVSYFTHYERELSSMHSSVSRAETALAAKSHEDIIDILELLLEHRQLTKENLKEQLRIRFPGSNTVAMNRSIDLVVRLWLMVNVRDIDEPVRTPQKVPIKWENDQSLLDMINTQLPTPSLYFDSNTRRLHPSFTVATMEKVCGLKVGWTDSLEDHLRLDLKRKQIWIFPVKEFLRNHLNASKQRQRDILPVAFLRETIMTLNLLFPRWDHQTQALLSAHHQTFHTTSPFEGPRRLDLSEFKYWRGHLLELYEEIYLAPADNWRQLWADRRNPHQWWTFWIAVVVLVLSIVSCITSIIQAWASVKSLRLR